MNPRQLLNLLWKSKSLKEWHANIYYIREQHSGFLPMWIRYYVRDLQFAKRIYLCNINKKYIQSIKQWHSEPLPAVLSFEEFSEVNEEELSAIFSETGADREMDFDRDIEEEKLYNSDKYPQLIRTT